MANSPKQKRMISTAAVLCLASGIILLLIRNELVLNAGLRDVLGTAAALVTISVISSVLVLSGVGILTFQYLDINSTGSKDASEQLHATGRLEELFVEQSRKLMLEVGKLAPGSMQLTTEERAGLVDTLRQRIDEAAATGILHEIEQRYAHAANNRVAASRARARLQRTSDRLSGEVRDLNRRGKINLVYGSLTTVAGLLLLTYVVFNDRATSPESTWVVLVGHYLPRLSLFLFIEVFAYFFLRLYRSVLSEIKYFQNEITTVEARVAALEAALLAGSDETISKLLLVLGETERNFRLTQGETTVELEKAKLELQAGKDLGSIVQGLATVMSGRGKSSGSS